MLPKEPLFPVRVRIPVAWGDMDALGHVNNLIFLRWFEDVRIRYFHEMALEPGENVGPILAHQRCDYLAPVTYPDTIEARTSVSRIGGKSFTMSFAIRSDHLGQDVARGEGVMVVYDYGAGRTVPLTDEVRQRIVELETGLFTDTV